MMVSEELEGLALGELKRLVVETQDFLSLACLPRQGTRTALLFC